MTKITALRKLSEKVVVVDCLDAPTARNNDICFWSGALAGRVDVFGDWIPVTVLHKFTALLATIRVVYLVVVLVVQHILGLRPVDVVVLDGVSTPLFLLRMVKIPTLFYCHFPDKVCSNAVHFFNCCALRFNVFVLTSFSFSCCAQTAALR